MPAPPLSLYLLPKAEESGSGRQDRVVIKDRAQEWGNLELILYLVAEWLFSDFLTCLKWGGQQDIPHGAAMKVMWERI